MATQLEINYGIKCELDTSEAPHTEPTWSCLLYTSDAADE